MRKARTGSLPATELRFTVPRVQTKNNAVPAALPMALAALRPRYEDWGEPWRKPRAPAALAQADSLEVGHGIGPVQHFSRMVVVFTGECTVSHFARKNTMEQAHTLLIKHN